MPTEPDQPELPHGRLVLDAEGRVEEADARALSVLGLSAGTGPAVLADVHRALEAGRLLPGPDSPAAFVRRTRLAGPPERTVEAACCRDRAGGWTMVLRRLGQRRSWFESQDDQARLLATFSHELRTPLTSLKTSLALLDREREAMPEMPEKSRQLLAASRRNVDRLVRLVADLLDAMTVGAGRLELTLGDEEPAELVRAALRSTADRTGRSDLSEGGPMEGLPPVRADREKVLRVLEELLDNAVKCTEPGSGIEASASRAGDEVIFRVRDHGPGIAEDQREAIFQPFHQVDMSLTRGVAGLGLGLAICKGIVEEHGGLIAVEGDPDGGSIFSFTLHVGGGA